jgi:hypothetical protein
MVICYEKNQTVYFNRVKTFAPVRRHATRTSGEILKKGKDFRKKG